MEGRMTVYGCQPSEERRALLCAGRDNLYAYCKAAPRPKRCTMGQKAERGGL
jgi:hypothetical protein